MLHSRLRSRITRGPGSASRESLAFGFREEDSVMPRARARALLPLPFVPGRRTAFLACACAALLAGAAHADAPTATRSEFPDRRLGGVTASDAALCGAGLATDPGSSFYGNPALALVGPRAARLAGGLLLPARDDLRASTTDFADASGFAALGEIGARLRVKGLG